jgi:nicotinamide-nucleotide amidase
MMEATAQRVVEAAIAHRLTIATAESCTGGMVAAALTGIAGASAVLGFGFITYANAAKSALLGVPEVLLEAHGAVSEPVAKIMAEGALIAAGADIAIAVTGIAGPGGGGEAKPVGLVWFGLARRNGTTIALHHVFSGDRNAVRAAATETALTMLNDAILN